MAANRSFTNYIEKRFDNNFWVVAEQYLNDNKDSLCSKLRRIYCFLQVLFGKKCRGFGHYCMSILDNVAAVSGQGGGSSDCRIPLQTLVTYSNFFIHKLIICMF